MGFYVVTGSAGAIGSTIVTYLIVQGHEVACWDICDGQDITDNDTLDTLIQQLPPHIDGIIHAAGVQVCKAFWDLTLTDWDRMHAVNEKAFVCMVGKLIDRLEPVQGCAIAIGSVHATCTSAHMSGYAASKAGLVGLVRGMAIEAAQKHVRVVCLSPGAVDTAMCRANITNDGAHPEKWEPFCARIPGHRICSPYDVARMCGTILDGPSCLTGCNIVVDGAASCLLGTES